MNAMHAAPRHAAADHTIGAELERSRLEHRERRLRLVVGALRARREATDGPVPVPLHQAIVDFSSELATVQRWLGERRRRA